MEETVPENEFSVYIKKGKRFDSRKNLNCVKVLLFSYMIKEGLIVSINDNYQGVYELRIRIDEENDFTKISKEFFVRFLTNWLFASIRVDKKRMQGDKRYCKLFTSFKNGMCNSDNDLSGYCKKCQYIS